MSAPLIGQDWRKDLESLQPDWNSYGSVRISSEALDTVAAFSVVPRSQGGVQLEIHKDGFDLEIWIEPDGKIDGVLVGRKL